MRLVANAIQTWTGSQRAGDFLVEESPLPKSALFFVQSLRPRDVDSAIFVAASGVSFGPVELA